MNLNKKLSKLDIPADSSGPVTGRYSHAAHAHVLENIHNAVVQSGAKYTTRTDDLSLYDETLADWEVALLGGPLAKGNKPSDVLPYEKQQTVRYSDEHLAPESSRSSLGKVGVASETEEALVVEGVKTWVKGAIKPGYYTVVAGETDYEWRSDHQRYGWGPIPLDSPFLAEHRVQIIREAIDVFAESEPDTMLLELIQKLSAGENIPRAVTEKLLAVSPSLIVEYKELFPGFRFDTAYIDSMIAIGKTGLLMSDSYSS